MTRRMPPIPTDTEWAIEQQARLSRLIGRTIERAEWTADEHLHLTMTNGSSCIIQGLGYDGMWDQVSIHWKK
jgi:hypothetical protein